MERPDDIYGTGYLNHPNCTVAQPYTTFSIDTTGSADPILLFSC